MAYQKVTLMCPDCEADFEASYSPGRPAQTYGPIERCYPEDPAELDIEDECPECGYTFTEDDLERFCLGIEEDARDDGRY